MFNNGSGKSAVFLKSSSLFANLVPQHYKSYTNPLPPIRKMTKEEISQQFAQFERKYPDRKYPDRKIKKEINEFFESRNIDTKGIRSREEVANELHVE